MNALDNNPMKTFKRCCLLIAFALMVPLYDMIAQEIGLQMGSMREMFKEGMPATLARIKELGVTELEGGGGRGVDRETFKKLVKENGLKIVATGASFERLQN